MIGNGQPERLGRTWKVGALAKATGLTVRTLHYYDQIGLLRPSARLAGGHRLYDAADVARLYRIIRLCQLGFPLSQVAQVLAEPEWQLAPAIERHLAEARHRTAIAARLCARLAGMAAELARQVDPSPEELFATVEEMIIMDGTVHGTTSLLMYDDVDAHYASTVAAGAQIVCEPVDQPYGVREYGASDPEGQIWWFHSPLS